MTIFSFRCPACGVRVDGEDVLEAFEDLDLDDDGKEATVECPTCEEPLTVTLEISLEFHAERADDGSDEGEAA